MSDRLIIERSANGQMGTSLPAMDVPEQALSDLIPDSYLRASEMRLPEVSEPEVIRHYVGCRRRIIMWTKTCILWAAVP